MATLMAPRNFLSRCLHSEHMGPTAVARGEALEPGVPSGGIFVERESALAKKKLAPDPAVSKRGLCSSLLILPGG